MASSQTDNRESPNDEETYDWLTVMVGPKVSRTDCIWFGRIEKEWEQFDDDMRVVVCGEPVEYIPLPRSMTAAEVNRWLDDDEWLEAIKRKYYDDRAFGAGEVDP